MKKVATIVLLLVGATSVNADQLTFGFNSPAFSGNGYSTHVLTIHQLEQQRKDKIAADEQAIIDQAERDLRNTNAYKFQNNLESRIYAQLSRQIADNLFGEGGTTTVGEWAEAETPFGDNIRWKRDVDNRIYVEVYDSNGDLTSSFDVPVGEFAF
jgi:predicted choloylglycine hydrolase